MQIFNSLYVFQQIVMSDSDEPDMPDLFGRAETSSTGRVTPDDLSSVDGAAGTSTPTCTTSLRRRKKKRGRPPVYLKGEVLESWLERESGNKYSVGGIPFVSNSSSVMHLGSNPDVPDVLQSETN